MSAQPVPFIPHDAPFNADQRAWLNGFLAGLYSSAPAPQAFAVPVPASENVAVYFATQSGTAERLAKKFAKELKTAGHNATVTSLTDVTPSHLAEQTNAVFFVSTYGDGEAPDHAKAFRDALMGADSLSLASLRYSVFGLGDKTYEQFCRFGVELDDRLADLGALRITSRVESDVDVDEPFAAWKGTCVTQIGKKSNGANGTKHAEVATAAAAAQPVKQSLYSRENPLHATVVDRRALTSNISSKLTIHLGLQLNEDLPYQAGDACGVLAQNDAVLVDETLSLLPFGADTMVEVPKAGACSLREALLHHYQHTRLSRKMVQAFAEKTKCKTLSALLPAEQAAHLDTFLYDRGLIDLLHAYPGAIDAPEELLTMLPRLAPRLYSISSSPAKHGLELHCTIGVVRYRSHNRERGGVASTMLAERVDVGETVPVYIQPNKKFRLPVDSNTPIIMIGPGTGIAPFRAFLHEREALGQKGRNWLFFGERSAQTDYLYSEELRSMSESGHLTRLDTAFSRDQAHKIYVQDRMIEHGATFWQWLQEDARVYVCGDASRMAKDVDSALHTLIEKHGGMSNEAAREYVSQMHDDGRYHRDVY
ncbi:sulfite reductase flavoprotein subunit alpha [Terriglobus sp. 2YAB30_2]|uniref:diflavin oxidoreductase n=1 Tax=unclassified Terriglobus TaxID=2628988 RepID=UPI003F977D14